jgi:hypothetical protein
MNATEPPVMDVDTEEVTTLGKWAAGAVIALGVVFFLFVGFWSFLSLFWLLPLAVPAAYFYFRGDKPAPEADLNEELVLAPRDIAIEMTDDPDEVTAKIVDTRENRLASQIKAAADTHDWVRVAELAGAARVRDDAPADA